MGPFRLKGLLDCIDGGGEPSNLFQQSALTFTVEHPSNVHSPLQRTTAQYGNITKHLASKIGITSTTRGLGQIEQYMNHYTGPGNQKFTGGLESNMLQTQNSPRG